MGYTQMSILSLFRSTHVSSRSRLVGRPARAKLRLEELEERCLPSRLVSLWEAEGNANDEFHRNDGAFVGTPQYTQGVRGQAFSFDSTNYVQIPASSTLDVSKLTLAGWIAPTFAGRPTHAHDADVIFEKFTFATAGGYIIGDAMDPTPGAYLNDPNGVPQGTPFFSLVVNNTIEQIFGSSAIPNDGQFH